jgi:hypothetical protein
VVVATWRHCSPVRAVRISRSVLARGSVNSSWAGGYRQLEHQVIVCEVTEIASTGGVRVGVVVVVGAVVVVLDVVVVVVLMVVAGVTV